MKFRQFHSISVLFPVHLLLLMVSCAPSLYEITADMLEQGKNDEVITRMRKELLTAPDDPQFLKYMGIALYNKKFYTDAVNNFQKALRVDPEDDQAVYYLAASYEGTFDFDKAIQYYRRYNDLTIFGEYRDLVEARIKVLYRQQMQIEAKRALVEESQLDVAKIPMNTLAVLYFENRGKLRNLDPLQKGLAEMMITDFSKVSSVRVVERIRLQKLVEELNLGESGLVDEKTAPRVGKLLGAFRLVKGSFFDLTSDKVRIDAFVARTRSGELDGVTDISGNMNDFFRLEKELVFKILDELKIKITDDEREAILTIPTENFFAFLQYSEGLDYEDKGLYTQAIESYSKAVQSDPKFTQAKSSLNTVQKTQQIVGSPTTTGTSGTVAPAAQPAPPPPPPSSSDTRQSVSQTQDRATTTSINTGSGIAPPTGSQTQQQPPPQVPVTPTPLISPLPEPPKPPM